MRERARAKGALVGAALALVSTTARADDLGHVEADARPLLDLTWDAPASCPDRAWVERRVLELVGPRRPEQHRLVARGELAPRAERWVMHLGPRDGAVREVVGDDCARLAEAAALILALDIDPDALAPRAPPERPDPAPAPPPHPVRARVAAPVAPPPVASPIHLALGADAIFAPSELPRASMGAGVHVAASRGAAALEIGALAFAPQLSTGGPRPGLAGAEVSLALLDLRGCATSPVISPRLGFALDVCGGAEIARMATRGVNIARPSSEASLFGAALATGALRLFADRAVALRAGASVGVPLGAPTVVIAGLGDVFEPPRAFVRIFVGIDGRVF